MSAVPAIEVDNLISRFGDRTVHDGLSLNVAPSEILGVVGASGAGKTVLLNSCIGLRQPQGGSIKLFGDDLWSASPKGRIALQQRFGVLFQQGALFSALNVRQNVAAPMIEHSSLSPRAADEVAQMKLALVGLPPEAGDLKPSELSGGMRKRAGLARALALDPELIFLDEPTAGLDPLSAEAFDALILALSQSLKISVFMITHDLDSLYAICNRVAVIADKKVVAEGPLSELEKSSHPWVKSYFLGPRGRAAKGAR